MATEETIDYFDLLVECAKKVVETIPKDTPAKTFWLKRIRAAHRDLSVYMSSSFVDVRMSIDDQRPNRLNDLLARLARECTMATWHLNIQAEDGEDNPEVVARQLTETTVRARIHI